MEDIQYSIMITGGHLTPAVSVIEAIQQIHPNWKIMFVGRVTAMEGSDIPSEEARVIAGMGIPFLPLSTGRIRVYPSIRSLFSLLNIPAGCMRAIMIVRKWKPSVVVSFGGYLAFPVALAGWIFRIPVITHEQTFSAGLANRCIGIIARVICTSHPESAKYFPRARTVLTGLPIRPVMFHPPEHPTLSVQSGRAVIYITGGMTGASVINQAIFQIISRLTKIYTVVHQTGRFGLERARVERQKLRWDKRKHYTIAPYFDGPDHSWLMHHCRVIVGRTGANITAEIIRIGCPSICIPLENSRAGEQLQNAMSLIPTGNSYIIREYELLPDLLYNRIRLLVNESGKKSFKTGSIGSDASDAVVRVLETVLRNG